jgi:predicted MFS family arabinose efflux permease
MLKTLGQRDFALLWFGGLVSLIGDWVLLLALPYYVYQRTGSILATAAISLAQLGPAALLGSVAGVFVDRWELRRTLVFTNLLQTGAALLLLFVWSSGWIWMSYAVSLIQAALRTFMVPAENALLPRLVDETHLVPAYALGGLSTNMARLAGPPLGGALLGFLGLQAITLFDSGSFLFAAAMIALITAPARPLPGEQRIVQKVPKPSVVTEWVALWREWAEGLRLIRRSRLLVMLVLVVGITTFGGTMIDPLYPPFVKDVLRAGPLGFGWLLTAQAIGGIVGGLIVGHLGSAVPVGRLLGWGNILVGLLLLVQYNVPILPVSLAIAFAIGPEQVAAGVGLQTLLQSRVPGPFKGRVFGAMGTNVALLSMLGAAVAGPLGTRTGAVPALNMAAALTIVAGVVALATLPHPEQDTPSRDTVSAE